MWSGKVNPAGGAKIITYSKSLEATVAPQADNLLFEWPHDFKGRIVAIEIGADAIAGAAEAQFKRFDASAPATNDMTTSTKLVPADDMLIIDSDDADTVLAEEVFEKGDRMLLDLTVATTTRLQINVHIAVG